DYGIFAGRTASLAHPVTNLALFFTSLYSAYLGYNWRRLRGIGEELKELSAQMPKLSSGLAKAPLSEMIAQLSATRKDLLVGNLKDKHQTTGSILLGVGVTVSVMGAFNTYMRAGKLFPGPHLYAGMAITILWA
ncbi:hypothetical protein B484DRAFT_312096, partial [Ochromonadaceae sp. CCMP2298]